VDSLTLTLADAQALRALFDNQLSKGRAFVPGGSGVAERAACALVLEHGGRVHRLAAEVVHVRLEEPGPGVGLQLAKLDVEAAAALREFVEAAEASVEDAEVPAGAMEAVSDEDAAEDDEETDDPRRRNIFERIQGLTLPEQLKLAAAGTLQERVILERTYGPMVWETLLRNARLTAPEAARIARKGTLPRPLVDLIAGNGSWVATGEVQRALLSNPRSSLLVVRKILRMMPRPDLLLVPQQTAYPPAVRQAAKAMLGQK
jgi:hypothetical protein